MRQLLHLIVLLLGASLTGRADQGYRWDFNFADSDHGFAAGFADYPSLLQSLSTRSVSADFADYQLTSDWRPRPDYLGGAQSLFISGNNHSDDLWMYWKKHITGLEPLTAYVLTMEVEFASMYPTGMVGVGGAPGDGVHFKTGFTSFEPMAIQVGDYLRMNLDKGNQSRGGTNVLLRGTIAKPADGNLDYVYLTRHHHGNPQTVTTAADGSLWLIFGTDSGFEGTTALYYTRVTVWANRPAEPALWLERNESVGGFRLIWNSGSLQTSTNLSDWAPAIVLQRPFVPQVDSEMQRFWRLFTVGP